MSQRCAIVIGLPRLKKAGAVTAVTVVSMHRTMSNLTFMSKFVERLVFRQLVALMPDLQSAYRRKRSCSTLGPVCSGTGD